MINRIYVTRAAMFGDRLQFRMGIVEDGRCHILMPFMVKTLSESEQGMEHPPCLELALTESQRLMDELWNCGIRPTEGAGSAGSLAATERHLSDMRALVFKFKPRTP